MNRLPFIACIVVLAAGAAGALAAERVVDDSGVMAISVAELFEPADTVTLDGGTDLAAERGTTVSLPDNWKRRPSRQTARAIYRLDFDPSPADAPWIYIPRVRTNAAFYLNGAFIWTGGRMSPPLTRHANSPFFLPLPTALLKPGRNELRIVVASPAGTNGGLSAAFVGPHERLSPQYAARQLAQNHGVVLTSTVIAATSLYILFVWRVTRRREPGYLYAAIAGLIWSIRNLNLVWKDYPVETEGAQSLVEAFNSVGHAWFLGFFGLFLLHEFGKMQARTGRAFAGAIVVFMLLAPLPFWAFGSPTPALTILLAAAAPLLAYMTWVLAAGAARQRTAGAVIFALLFVVLIALQVYDHLILRGVLGFDSIYLGHYGGLFFFIGIAHMLVAKYGKALSDYESLNATLEERLRLRENELAASYREFSRLESRKAAFEERDRIVRDLHDGLGARLLSVIHEVRRHELARQELEEMLQECLGDLRLAIDSADLQTQHLGTVLAGLRYRMNQGLAAAGIQLKWNVCEIPERYSLGATGTLHLLRLTQEAIANALKHSRATALEVNLGFTQGALQLEIRDDGVGFEGAPPSAGRGLANMRQRARHLNATLTCETSPRGTTVRLALPPEAPGRASD